MATEKSIETAIRKALEKRGCLVRKRHGGGYGTLAGEPDLYGCYTGLAFVIEVKRPGGKLTPLQERRLKEWRDAGAATYVAYSVGSAISWFEEWTGEKHEQV